MSHLWGECLGTLAILFLEWPDSPHVSVSSRVKKHTCTDARVRPSYAAPPCTHRSLRGKLSQLSWYSGGCCFLIAFPGLVSTATTACTIMHFRDVMILLSRVQVGTVELLHPSLCAVWPLSEEPTAAHGNQETSNFRKASLVWIPLLATQSHNSSIGSLLC